MAPPLPLALLAEKVEVATLRVPVPLASPLLTAPPVRRWQCCRRTSSRPPSEPRCHRCPRCRWPRRCGRRCCSPKRSSWSPLGRPCRRCRRYLCPAVGAGGVPRKSRAIDGQGAGPAAVAVVDGAAVVADAIAGESGAADAEGAGAGGVPVVDGPAPVSCIGGKRGAG